jgi:hypothetical protein
VRLSATKDSAWEEKEAAILALGAVAEGCISGLLPHLAQVRTFCFIVEMCTVEMARQDSVRPRACQCVI